jgi:hypothetical protein
MKKNLRIEFIPPDDAIISQSKTHCILNLSGLPLLPGTFLDCSLAFAHQGATPIVVRLSGSWKAERRVPIELSFPHRGAWDIQGIDCALGDQSGCILLQWRIPMQSSMIVAPRIPRNSTLPLISSTQRPGDLSPDTVNRLGDPFDIKPYHPSDGVKKIVWKAFAKSGELLARHPEPSMTPEGFVAICVLARPEDDDLCGKALSYIASLKELTLDLLVGCQGHAGRTLGHDFETSKNLLIDSTWDAARTSTNALVHDLEALIEGCSASASQITLRKMVVFCSGARLANAREAETVVQLAAWLDTHDIEPVFFLTQPPTLPNQNASTLTSRAQALLVATDSSVHGSFSIASYQEFLSTCLSKQWEVFV